MFDVDVVVNFVKKCGCFLKVFVLVVDEFDEFVVKRGRGWFKGLKLVKKKEIVFKFLGLKWFCGCLKGLFKKKLLIVELNEKKSLKKGSEWRKNMEFWWFFSVLDIVL